MGGGASVDAYLVCVRVAQRLVRCRVGCDGFCVVGVGVLWYLEDAMLSTSRSKPGPFPKRHVLPNRPPPHGVYFWSDMDDVLIRRVQQQIRIVLVCGGCLHLVARRHLVARAATLQR